MVLMKKKIIIWVVVLLCFSAGVAGAEPIDEAAMATELYQAQSLANIKNGVYGIPEKVLNTYFSNIALSNPKVKEANLSVLDKDKIVITINAEGVGVLRLTCAIKEFHYDKDNAVLELYIAKKELVGSGIASWFLNKMSVGMITSIYGNPLQDLDSKIKGNTLDINLKPFANSLFKNGIGQSVIDMLVISKATTEQGVIYIHTNVAVNLLTPENMVN